MYLIYIYKRNITLRLITISPKAGTFEIWHEYTFHEVDATTNEFHENAQFKWETQTKSGAAASTYKSSLTVNRVKR